LVDDAHWVAHSTHPAFGEGYPDVGVAHSLLGTEEGILVFMTLVPDLAPGPYQEYCFGDGDQGPPPADFWQTRDRCIRVFREEEGDSWRLDSYFVVRPHRLPDDRHEFRYTVQDGEIVFQPNPLIGWHVSIAPGAAVAVTSTVDRRLRFLASGGEELDLTHVAIVDAAHDDPNQTTDRFELTFSGLAPAGSVRVELEVGNDEEPLSAKGAIEYQGRLVAEMSGTARDLLVEWR
jgi:hypothetical protein